MSYSFERFEENGNCWYEFSTKNSIVYRVYFYNASDSSFLYGYKKICKNGFLFGITKTEEFDGLIQHFDRAIKATTVDILIDFFNKNREAILIYHCDDSDGKQYKRDQNFVKWNDDFNINGTYYFDRSILPANTEDGIKYYYLGIILLDENPQKQLIINEYNEAKSDLIKVK